MDESIDPSVRMLEGSRPRLRAGLRFSFQEFWGTRCALIEDPLTSKHYRVGLPEYFLLRQLDGRSTWSEVFARASNLCGRDSLSSAEALRLLAWLSETRLADFGQGQPAAVPSAPLPDPENPLSRLPRFLNLIFLRLPLGRPDPIFAKAAPWLGWACGRAGLGVWLLAVLVGSLSLASHWDLFVRDAEGVLSSFNWLWLGAAWVLLKCLHEFWHGIVCRHYGGAVREAGVFFIVFVPVGYVDATSSWSFPSKWRRMHVALAGVFIELFAASLAAVLWSVLDEGVARTLAYNIVIMASVTTLFFNANPLMRFDGYYVLADYLEIPNLYSNGGSHLAALAKRFILGLRNAAAPDFKDRETVVTSVYGVFALAWRGVVYVGLFSAASVLFHGAGFAVGAIATLAMVIPRAVRFHRYLQDGSGLEAPSLRVYGPRTALAGTILALILLTPFKPLMKAPAVVQIKDQHIVRAQCPGFVTAVRVRDNERVAAGQLLLEMENVDETAALHKLRVRVSRQEIKTRQAYAKRDVAAMKNEMAALEAFQTQLAEKEAYMASLRVSAPVDGAVIARRIDELSGRYLRAGEEILGVGVLPASELKVSVAQGDVAHFRGQVGKPLQVKIVGRSGKAAAVLESVEPRAGREIPHAALASLAGGPLAVVRRREAASPRSLNSHDDFELLAPVFIATARLTDGPGGLAAGETARVRFRSRLGLPLWKRGYQAVERRIQYLRSKREKTLSGPILAEPPGGVTSAV